MLLLCKRELTAYDVEREKNDQHTIGIQVKAGESTTLTHVPAAVVVDPASVSLPPMQLGDGYQGEFTLVNYGLIRAENLRLELPDEGVYRFELLPGVPDSLDAKERVTVPYRVTRVQPVQGAGDGSGGGDNCGYTLACWTIPYEFPCPNGAIILKEAKYCANVWLGDCPPSDSSEEPDSYRPPIWQISGGSLGGGSRSGGSRTSGGQASSAGDPIPGTEEDCYPTCSDRECCGKCGEKPTCDSCLIPTLSSVHALNRSYHTEGPGLSVKTPGGYLSVSPKYKDGIWLFGPEQSGPDGLPAEAGNLQFHQYGDAQRGYVISSIIKDGGIAYNLPAENFALKKVYDDDGILVSEQYVYTGERIYQHAKAYAIVKTDTGYRWKKTTGEWQDYDENGRLTAFGNRRGTTATVLYDAAGNVRGYADKNGTQVLWVEYNAEGRIARLRDAAGQQVTYAYDTQGRLASIIDVSAPSTGSGQVTETTYQYTGSQLTKVIKPGGQEANISYTQAGNVQSVKDEEGEGSTFNYSYDSRKGEYYTRITSSSGTITEVWYDEDGDTKRVALDGETVQTIQQDTERNALTITDKCGLKTRQEYDEWDNLTKVISPDGATVSYEYEHTFHQQIKKIDDRGIVTTYNYNDSGNLLKQVEAAGIEAERVIEYEYDNEERVTKFTETTDTGTTRITDYEYNSTGNMIRRTVIVNNDVEQITEYTYDTGGNLKNMIEKRIDGDTIAVTMTEYDTSGYITKKVDPEGNETLYTYDSMGNRLTMTIQDERGERQYEYNEMGRNTKLTDPFGNVTQWEYDATGNLRSVTVNGKTESMYVYDDESNLIQYTDRTGNTYRFEYNAEGQMIREIDPEEKQIRYTYDTVGNLVKIIDGNGNEVVMEYGDIPESEGSCLSCSPCSGESGGVKHLRKIIYPTFTKEYRYDAQGRKTEEIYILSDTETYSTRFTYDASGNLLSKTDNEGNTITYEYDTPGQKVIATDSSGQTQYNYDEGGNLIALTDAKGHVTRFDYNEAGKLHKEIRPMEQEITYEYDETDRLVKLVDAKDQMVEYVYAEETGRLTEIRYRSATEEKTVILTYDSDGNLQSYNDGITSAEYTYDDMHRKLSETVNYGPFSKTYTYTYYKNGLKKSFTMPDGTTYEYIYGNNNEFREVQLPSIGAITFSSYIWNSPTRITFPGGSKREYAYDPLMRIRQITATDPGQNTVMNYQYTYDGMNNVLTKETRHGLYAYTYDDLYQLIHADNPPEKEDETFTYDAVGNRVITSGIPESWIYNENNELLGYADVTYTYDDNGNMIQKRVGDQVVFNYIYNIEDRLSMVVDGDGTVTATYYYDPFGRRLWKEVNGTKTYFLYADEGLVAEYDETGTEVRTYGYKPGSVWMSDPLFMKQSSDYYFYQNDSLGTPITTIGSNGSVVWSATYDSFGKAVVDVSSTITNNLQFSGHYFDPETGLHYNYYRYYDPETGRYLRPDPIGFDGGDVNLYRYAGNNPINNIDPFGLDWTISRDGGTQAEAVCCNDTVEELAKQIGLDANDWWKWLSPAGVGGYPASPSEKMKYRRFAIPNTVYAYWAGNISWFGRWHMSWNESISYLRNLGFGVIEQRHVQGSGFRLDDELESLMGPAKRRKKALHGLYFVGHGGKNDGLYYGHKWIGKIFIGFVAESELVLNYAHFEEIRSYPMALGLMFACFSNTGREELVGDSESHPRGGVIWNGYWWYFVPLWGGGSRESLDRYGGGTYHVKHWIRPGDQGTRTDM